MCKILFEPRDHVYRRASDGMRYMSVTHVVKLFSPPFHGLHHAKKTAAKKSVGKDKYALMYAAWTLELQDLVREGFISDPSEYPSLCAKFGLEKYSSVPPRKRHTLMPEFISFLEDHIPHWPSYEAETQRVLASYGTKREAGASGGTDLHDWKERAANMRGYETNTWDGLDYPVMPHGKAADGSNTNVVCRLNELPPGCYLELMIWYNFPEPVFSESLGEWICGICGQEDQVFLLESMEADMADHKTSKNKKLDTFGTRYRNMGFEMMQYPFDRWKSSDYNHYMLQLNLYAWMLEQGHGIKPRSQTLLHKDEILPVEYHPDKVSSSINMVLSMGL